ncbi:hypothetical protein Gotur_000236 [Gossypium turneri]
MIKRIWVLVLEISLLNPMGFNILINLMLRNMVFVIH